MVYFLKVVNSKCFIDNSIYYLNSISKKSTLLRYVNKITDIGIKNSDNSCFELGKLYMVGLGYKNFVLDGSLYILVGNCNYIVFSIPSSVKLYCRKNQIYFFSLDKSKLFDFMSLIKKVKNLNLYKGKGVIQFKNFKFTKLKVGKKQRFA